jgi:hypothetical protein
MATVNWAGRWSPPARPVRAAVAGLFSRRPGLPDVAEREKSGAEVVRRGTK